MLITPSTDWPGQLGDLDTGEFAELIEEFGELPVRWYRDAGPCPNTHNDPVLGSSGGYGSTALACPLCFGTSRLIKNMALPLTGRTSGKILCQNAMVGRSRSPIQLEGGEVICTFIEDDYPLAEGDRLLLGSRVSDYAELIKHTGDAYDALRYTPVHSILNVTLPPPTGEVTSGFAVQAASLGITWSSGAPTVGSQYTVRYRYYAVFVVATGGIHRRVRATNGAAFPSRAVLRQFNQGRLDRTEGTY